MLKRLVSQNKIRKEESVLYTVPVLYTLYTQLFQRKKKKKKKKQQKNLMPCLHLTVLTSRNET